MRILSHLVPAGHIIQLEQIRFDHSFPDDRNEYYLQIISQVLKDICQKFHRKFVAKVLTQHVFHDCSKVHLGKPYFIWSSKLWFQEDLIVFHYPQILHTGKGLFQFGNYWKQHWQIEGVQQILSTIRSCTSGQIIAVAILNTYIYGKGESCFVISSGTLVSQFKEKDECRFMDDLGKSLFWNEPGTPAT